MKGIAHFAVGVAAASCFPAAVSAGAQGNPLYFILGGVFGLLPDTLDFKVYRYFFRHDVEVVPDPLRPDAKLIADAVAGAVNTAFRTQKSVRIKLDTIRLGADAWQQYHVRFDVAKKVVEVRYGPIVDTGRNPRGGDDMSGEIAATARLECPIKLEYEANTTIDIFDGPLFEMEPAGDGRVIARFLPWHRQWTHGVTAGALFGAMAWLLWGPLAAAVVFMAVVLHGLVDQLGFMGNNFFFPFTRRRVEGWKLMHSDEMLPNFAAVWISCLVVFWNLYSAFPGRLPDLSPAQIVLYGALIPGIAGWFLLSRNDSVAR